MHAKFTNEYGTLRIDLYPRDSSKNPDGTIHTELEDIDIGFFGTHYLIEIKDKNTHYILRVKNIGLGKGTGLKAVYTNGDITVGVVE